MPLITCKGDNEPAARGNRWIHLKAFPPTHTLVCCLLSARLPILVFSADISFFALIYFPVLDFPSTASLKLSALLKRQ